MWSSSPRSWSWIFGAVIALGLAASAEAATANFQGNCAWNGAHTQFTCQFDALRPAGSPTSCAPSIVWKYFWDYGDGTNSGLTGNSVVSHTYASSVVNPEVKLTVTCLDGSTANKSRYINHPFGVPGGININGTWN